MSTGPGKQQGKYQQNTFFLESNEFNFFADNYGNKGKKGATVMPNGPKQQEKNLSPQKNDNMMQGNGFQNNIPPSTDQNFMYQGGYPNNNFF